MLNIPPISTVYINTLKIYVQNMTNPYDLYEILNIVSGYVQLVDIAYSFNGLGGSKTINELREDKDNFKRETILEYDKLKKYEYTATDFIHIFLNGYYITITELLIEQKINKRG